MKLVIKNEVGFLEKRIESSYKSIKNAFALNKSEKAPFYLDKIMIFFFTPL